MALANYKVTITEQDYQFSTYVAWVSATSRNQAIAKGAALAGQAKTRREWNRTGRDPGEEGLYLPEIKLEIVTNFDEFWEHQDQVIATSG